MGLYHTHQTSRFGYELVSGSNCDTAGDLICDTPADPGLSSSNVDTTCKYKGTSRDPDGNTYNPDTRNVMSYSRAVRIFFEFSLIIVVLS